MSPGTRPLNDIDGGYGWVIVFSAFCIGFISDGIVFSFGIMLVEFLEEFHQGRASVTIIGAMLTGVMHLVGPVAGALSDKVGCRAVAMAGAAISCAGLTISFFAKSVIYLCVSFGFIGGLGFGLMYLPASVSVIRYFKKRRALANGIAICGSGAGTVAFNQLSRFLIEQYGWRGTILIEGGIALNGVACGLLLRPLYGNPSHDSTELDKGDNGLVQIKNGTDDEFTKYDRFQSSDTSYVIDDSELDSCLYEKSPALEEHSTCKTTKSSKTTRYKNSVIQKFGTCNTIFKFDLLRDGRCWMFLMSAFVMQLAFTIPFNFVPDQAVENGMTKYQASWLISSIGITNTISRILLGWIGDRPGINRMVMLESMLFLAGIFTGFSPLMKTFETKLIYTSIYGVLIGGYVMLCPIVLADMFGADVIAKSFGLLMFSVGVSGFLSTPIGGWLFDVTGNYEVSFIVAGAEFILSGVLLLFAKCFVTTNKT